jgi:CheY-like chemotaxis protein
LAVAKVLVELHDGTIEARSEGEGRGAEFTVVLPKVAPIAEPSPPARRVLVVDDNPDHLALLAELLRGRGYDVIEANDASEALRIVSDHKPDACVIDIGLPGMDGYELARRLREIPATRESRLIAVTGYGTKSDKEAFEEAGFDHFFPKPTDIEELNRALSQNKANGTHETFLEKKFLSTLFPFPGNMYLFGDLRLVPCCADFHNAFEFSNCPG